MNIIKNIILDYEKIINTNIKIPLDNEYGYFGVGFMSAGKKTDKNYPNTFFFRVDDDYMKYQEVVLPLSIIKKVKTVRKNLKFIGNRFGNV